MRNARALNPAGFAAAYDQAYFSDLLDKGFVARNPEIAYARLVSADGVEPGASGHHCPAITGMREVIRQVDPSAFAGCALMITAPHTHWPAGPIVETFDADLQRYWIGPPREYSRVWPISFVYTPDGPASYEWAEESLFDDLADLHRAYRIIEQVGEQLAGAPCCQRLPMPVGLAINHRFKKIAGPLFWSTMEVPDAETGLSYVVKDTFERAADIPFAGQVGWSVRDEAFSSQRFSEAGKFLDSVIAGMSLAEVEDLLERMRRGSNAGMA